MQHELGKTLLIVNPAAKTGEGALAGAHAAALLRDAGVQLDCVLTESPLHALELAANAAHYRTVVALGGDGVIHETANGLMSIEGGKRPVLGVIPVGSGNDYARSLGISEEVDTACGQLLASRVRPVDIGVCNGHYFVETVSMGLDAAIALDTVERRKRTDKTGGALYFEAGLNQLLFHRDIHRYHARFDQGLQEEGQSLTFAVQLGKTYGGGFLICPEAELDDGFFDICIAHPPLGLWGAVKLFARAKEGKHTGAPQIEMRRAASLKVRFEGVVPAQMDGEDCSGVYFALEVHPYALNVVHAPEEMKF